MMQVRKPSSEESLTERKSDKFRGDAVRTHDRSREGLALLSHMIARAYLRDRRQSGSDGNVEETRISQTGLQNSKEVEGETRANEETQQLP